MYGDDNLVHYDYFDYVDADGLIQQYEPDLDMDFVEFKNLMKKKMLYRQKLNLNHYFAVFI